MVCPFCNAEDTAVVDSRKNVDGDAIRRRRQCSVCNTRFTTYEKSEIELIVKKRNGNLEEFQYEKLFSGVENAFGGQELSEKKLKKNKKNYCSNSLARSPILAPPAINLFTSSLPSSDDNPEPITSPKLKKVYRSAIRRA